MAINLEAFPRKQLHTIFPHSVSNAVKNWYRCDEFQ
jgi:hypothetical protein